MIDPHEALLEFHRVLGHTIRPRPGIDLYNEAHDNFHPDIKLRLRLINEEAGEFEAAVFEGKIVAIADALADLLYVTYGAAITFGIDIRPIFEEVHRTNMAKAGAPKDIGGKTLKPPGWGPPRIAELLEKQGDLC